MDFPGSAMAAITAWVDRATTTQETPDRRNYHNTAAIPGAGCLDYKSGVRQSPGCVRRGRYVNPASWHSKRPRQEGSNIRPGEG